jgi:hypothetical protein
MRLFELTVDFTEDECEAEYADCQDDDERGGSLSVAMPVEMHSSSAAPGSSVDGEPSKIVPPSLQATLDAYKNPSVLIAMLKILTSEGEIWLCFLIFFSDSVCIFGLFTSILVITNQSKKYPRGT